MSSIRNETEIVLLLMEWYKKNKKNYFFRKTRDPYHVWISEISLHQTRIQYAADKIEHFLTTFPDVFSLAAAKEEDVLRAFSGLGYYSRARNIHKAARILVEKYNGEFPAVHKDLASLPSIGDYTASAILSLSFGEKHPAVDANLERIIFRIYGGQLAQASGVAMPWSKHVIRRGLQFAPVTGGIKNPVRIIIRRWMDLGVHPGDLNEALMELGQNICTPGTPSCGICPLEKNCDAAHTADFSLPPKEKPAIKDILWVFFSVFQNTAEGREYLLQKNPKGFPFLRSHFLPLSQVYDKEGRLWASSCPEEDWPSGHNPWEFFSSYDGFRHSITNHRIVVKVFPLESPMDSQCEDSVWEKDLSIYQISSLSAKLFRILNGFS